MTILQSLNRYYGRMTERGEAELPGFSREKISFAIVLSCDGEPADVVDLRIQNEKRKLVPQLMEVPAAVKRTAGIQPNRFWDKSSYVLGRTAGEGKRTSDEHAAFKALHLDLLANADDEALSALRCFIEAWNPERFDTPPFGPEMLDTNIIFRLDGDRQAIHERDAAKHFLTTNRPESKADICLVTGIAGPVQRLHPTIKGVQGAQSSGAALVSFNLDAFTSYGKEQGANAPVSEAAAFRYGAALNRMLDRDSPNRLKRPIGDTTVVFWAEAEKVDAAEAAESMIAAWFEPPSNPTSDKNFQKEVQEAAKLRDQLEKVAAGRPEDADPKLSKNTRFYVLGLAPNAARLSVRYWLEDDFEQFAKRLLEHAREVAIEPLPRGWGLKQPSAQRLLVKTTALQEKFENIPDQLAGEVMRAILAGTRYPHAWLAAALIRLRAGDDPATGWHAAAIRAVLERDRRLRSDTDSLKNKQEIPVSLDKTREDDPAYHLGRLFAALETAQSLALGKNINATIRDRYFGAASATPAHVFPLLLRGAQNHVSKLRKDHKDFWIEREISEIVDQLPIDLPRSLKLEAQGRFAIGYYHQRQAQFAGRPKLADEIDDKNESIEGETNV